MRTYYCLPRLPEKVEDQIRLAAEKIIVQFSEEAWMKMERMLNDEFKTAEVPDESGVVINSSLKSEKAR